MIPNEFFGRHFNLIEENKKVARYAAENKLWIKNGRYFYPPYQWAFDFGRSWKQLDFEPEFKNPYTLLQEGAEIIGRKKEEGISDEYYQYLSNRYFDFKSRIDSYYSGKWDERLIRSMESGKWV